MAEVSEPEVETGPQSEPLAAEAPVAEMDSVQQPNGEEAAPAAPVEGIGVENSEAVVNGKDEDGAETTDLLGSGSLQASLQGPGVLSISLKDIAPPPRRPNSKVPGDFTKTILPAGTKEKRRDPFHILPIGQLLQQSGNYVGTAEWRLARDDIRATQVLTRIDDLKTRDLWSFRQLKKHVGPPRSKSHWDFMLDEMQWLREDFIQEKRWKVAAAFTVSRWVMEWHNATDKAALCVKRLPLKYPRDPDAMDSAADGEAALTADVARGSPAPDSRRSKKRRRDSDELMEDAQATKAEAKAAEPSPAAPAASAVAEEPKEDAVMVDGEITPVDGKAPTDDVPDDDAHTTLGSQGKAPVTEPPRIIRSNPGLTHVDLGVGPIPDDQKNVYAFTDNLEQQYVDPLNNANVVALSRMMSTKTRYADIRWDMYGQDRRSQKRMRLSRAADWKLEVPSIVGPFFNARRRDDKRPLVEPVQGRPRGIQQTLWTQEEEDVLMAYGKTYQHNWVLIAELMAAEHMPKSPWECYERYTALDNPEQRAKPRVARVDAKDRLAKHQKLISHILKRIRGRERPLSFASTQNAQPRKPVNLVAHETHQQAQLEAGVDPNSRPLTPLELSQVKARHDQEVRAQQDSHRTAQFGQNRSGGLGFQARPGFVQIPVNQMQNYRPAGRPGIALPAGSGGLQAVRPPLQQQLQRLPPGMTQDALKQVMLARALQQQHQQQQQQQQGLGATVARTQPGTANFSLPLQLQGGQTGEGGMRQFSASEIQAAQQVIANDPNLRAQLLARQQQTINAQRANLTPEQLIQLAQLRANPEAAASAQLANAIARPAQNAQTQALNQQRIQIMLQQQQQQHLQAQLQQMQGAAAAAAQNDQAGDGSGQSPARKRK